MSLIEIDNEHNLQYLKVVEEDERIFNKLKSYKFDLEKTEISEAIRNRMFAYNEAHNKLKDLLDKSQKQAAADYFVESCLFFLKAYFKDYIVKSEVSIWKEGRQNIRPDITIWSKKEEKLLAAIEVKAQLGRQRLTWKQDLQQREHEIKHKWPDTFFAVICFSEDNWQGFDRDENFGTKYFSLTSKNWQLTSTTFEKMIKEISNAIERTQNK
jgi:hypothetical protein